MAAADQKKPAATKKKKPTVTVATSKTADEYSAQLRKVRRTAADKKPPSDKKSIAQKTAFRQRHRSTFLTCLTIAFLLILAAFFRFCLEGYGCSALICAGCAFVTAFYHFVPKILKNSRTVIRIFTILLCIGLLIAGVTEALIIKASFGQPETATEYLLVLGAKVRASGPSLSLSNRINAAYDYLTAHPDAIAVVSGGQGTDEPITEAQCMYDRLTAMGIDPDRVWMEDKATSTWENLLFSLDLIEAKTGSRPEKLALLSSEYHLFRAGLFARKAGVEPIGIPARTTNPVLMVNYFLREIAGVWHYIILGSFGGHYHD